MPPKYAALPIVNTDKHIIIDAQYYPILKQFRWYIAKGPNAQAPRPHTFEVDDRLKALRNKSGRRSVSLERALMKPKERQWVKHLNGNLLDCRKENMVFVDRKDDAGVKKVSPEIR